MRLSTYKDQKCVHYVCMPSRVLELFINVTEIILLRRSVLGCEIDT
jgi:hypothetical protein